MERMQDKFTHKEVTQKGEERAYIYMSGLKTLWFNTGTLCNLACVNCYIESTPRNDRLVYLTHAEVAEYLDEIQRDDLLTDEIGITGGEPFMNPDIISIMEDILQRGFKLLILTNAMRPMMRHEQKLLEIKEKYSDLLTMRVSVDHFKRALHEEERGPRSWEPMMKGLRWLSDNDFTIDIAGRTRWGEDEDELRDGFEGFFEEYDIRINAHDQKQLMLFPEMDENASVPEITTECWDILGVDPESMMCASSRMVVKHKGEEKPSVMACTLLAYDQQFNMGETLKEASQDVYLNHPHCSKFCVLGGGACSVDG